ncbi:hypothetical protein CRG98_011922 [Punica granatum]|uniref:Uncharacterized protein n=1 Tax=Punica granatum TaxID=22663 RepID=A0A2I0KGV7_PUNGR|nr:hypothetical protein CRG98_011922 [Punica granatum]
MRWCRCSCPDCRQGGRGGLRNKWCASVGGGSEEVFFPDVAVHLPIRRARGRGRLWWVVGGSARAYVLSYKSFFLTCWCIFACVRARALSVHVGMRMPAGAGGWAG